MLLLMAAATLAGTPGAAPDATFVGIQATRILSSAAESVDEICRHEGAPDRSVVAGAPPSATPNPSRVSPAAEDTTSAKNAAAGETVDKVRGTETTFKATCARVAIAAGAGVGGYPYPHPITVGALHVGTRSGAATKNAKAEAETAATTTTTTRHVRVRRPGDSTKTMNLVIGGKPARPPRSSAPARVPVRVVPAAPAVDTIKDAAKTIDLRSSATNAKTIIALKGGSATGVCPGDDPSRETRLPSAPPPSHASHQVLLHDDTVANKIVGHDPTLLSSDRANNNNTAAMGVNL